MSSPIILLDACVLYPAALRDLIMHLAAHELIHAKWSAKIHEEWMAAVLRERPDLTRAKLERTKMLMNLHAGDCLVEGYEKRMETLALPDAGDRHVLAAAIEGGATSIVTWNLSDFPEAMLQEHGISLWTPDQLLLRLLRENWELVIESMRGHRASLKNPPRTAEQYLDTLEQQRLWGTVAKLKERHENL